METGLAHRAVLRHRQVIAAAMAARSRQVSVHWLSLGLFLGLAAAVSAGHAASFWLVQRLPFAWMFAIGTYLPTLIPALFAFVVVAVVGTFQQRAVSRAYLRNFDRLGIPQEIEALFEVLPEGLRLSTERITIFPRWHAVDTIERGTDGWVVSADQLTFLVPRDSFADAAAERLFVAALVERVSDQARERSGDAVTFAAGSADPGPAVEPATAEPTAPASPLRASTQITREEVSWGARVGFDRVAHGNRHAFFYPALSAIVGGLLGLVAAGLALVVVPVELALGNVMVFAGLTFVLPLAGGAAGLWLGYRALGRIFDKAYHAGLSSRGSPPTADCEWEVAEEGLVSRSDRGGSTTFWHAVHEVFRADAFWIVLSDLAANVIPRRAFADERAERAFIAAMLDRLPAVARERSRDAAAFAEASGLS